MNHKKTTEYAAWLEAFGFQVPGDKVIILRDAAREKVGNIYLPEDSVKAPLRGTIIMVGQTVDPELVRGKGKDDDSKKIGYYVGQRCLFNKYHTLNLRLPHPQNIEVIGEGFHPSDVYIVWDYREEGDQ